MISLTFYGGADEIGGTKILLEDGDMRLFFDFGTSYSQWNLFYEEFLKPRPAAGLLDILELGLLPPLQGLYRSDLEVPPTSLWERYSSRSGYRDFRGIKINGVLLSHAHLDHSGYVSFLREDIPIYSSATTALIAKAIQDTQGSSAFEREVAYFTPKKPGERGLRGESGVRNKRSWGLVDSPPPGSAAWEFWEKRLVKPRNRPPEWAPFDEQQKAPGLPAGVRSFAVDHSVPGAAAWAVETSEGWVAYTGDIRLHGEKGKETESSIQAIARLRPRLLLCEGTRAGDSRKATEEEVKYNSLKRIKGANHLAIADFGPRNIERLLSFLEVAQASSRQLLITLKDAYLLYAMNCLDPAVPTPRNHPQIKVYDEPQGSLDTWEHLLKAQNSSSLVPPEQVRADPAEFILAFSFWDIKHLIDISPRSGTYIYSSSEMYDEEQAADFRRLHQWLDHFNIKGIGLPMESKSSGKTEWSIPEEERGFHASGHATGDELVTLIKEISPRVLIPIHTPANGYSYFQEELKGTNIQVLHARPYATIRIPSPSTSSGRSVP